MRRASSPQVRKVSVFLCLPLCLPRVYVIAGRKGCLSENTGNQSLRCFYRFCSYCGRPCRASYKGRHGAVRGYCQTRAFAPLLCILGRMDNTVYSNGYRSGLDLQFTQPGPLGRLNHIYYTACRQLPLAVDFFRPRSLRLGFLWLLI